jgi:hypothetical protein
MRKTAIFLLLFIMLSINAISQTLPYKNPKLSVNERVEDLLQRMTLKEKFWQVFMIPGDSDEGKEKYRDGIFGFQTFAKGHTADAVGQMLTYGSSGTPKQTAEKINAMQKFFLEETRLGIPIIPQNLSCTFEGKDKSETKEVSFEILPELLQMLDKNMKWIVEPGDFRIMIGASSKDIRLMENLTVVSK